MNNNEKINFIKNNFHQYIDLSLNTSLLTTEPVNLVIPMDSLLKGDTTSDSRESYHHQKTYPSEYDINDILSKYEDYTYKKEDWVMCVCTKVIDGDTIEVKIPQENDGLFTYRYETVRLSGVNTPESGSQGFDVSKKFMEKVCFNYNESASATVTIDDEENKKIISDGEEITFHMKINRPDGKNLKDNVVNFTSIDTNYNINSKKIYLKIDDINPYDKYGRLLAVLIVNNKNINEILLKEQIAEIEYIPPSEFYPFDWGTPETDVYIYNFENDDISVLYPYFNSEMTNVVFTDKDDITKIYKYEFYKGNYFIRLNPFSQYIRMHLLPPGYDCSSSLLVFRDDMITKDNIDKTDDYLYYEERSPINCYYMENNIVRDRTSPDISNKKYNILEWLDTHCEFSYNISKSTKTFQNLQICAGYRYNKSAPYYSIHFTGIRDNTNITLEDRCTLLDINYDRIESKSNNITQHIIKNGAVCLPRNPRNIKASFENNIDHVGNIENVYHKTIKYINDILYIEEGPLKNRQKQIYHWVDVSKTN